MIDYISVKDIMKIADMDKPYIDILCNYKPFRIKIAKQRTGYGEKTFLSCPMCGHRREKLYQIDKYLICRACLPVNLYRCLQNTTIGGYRYISYKMHRYARNNKMEIKQPFHYYEYDKPKHKHWDRWRDNLTVMQALANMRFQSIFLRKIWSTETISSVLSSTNSLLYIYDLSEIDKYIINWDIGVNMNAIISKESAIVTNVGNALTMGR